MKSTQPTQQHQAPQQTLKGEPPVAQPLSLREQLQQRIREQSKPRAATQCVPPVGTKSSNPAAVAATAVKTAATNPINAA